MRITIASDSVHNPNDTIEPDVYLPISEAHKLFGFDGHIITKLYIDQYEIAALQERNGSYLARVTDGKTHTYPPDKMVYGVLSDLEHEKKQLQELESKKQECLDKYKVT